ncbi:Uncharacterised protein [Mycobacteroides abscessus subsp. abscessus]|nr:Uncharacterised protein [Mycobacteroides abscessus subsp. abscessus]
MQYPSESERKESPMFDDLLAAIVLLIDTLSAGDDVIT